MDDKTEDTPRLGIGSIVWRFTPERRVYARDESGRSVGGPLRREQWVEWEIRGETSRSWIALPKAWVSRPDDLDLGIKIPKRATPEQARQIGVALTEQAVEDDVWDHEHRWRVARAVQNIDPAMLRKIAELIGYNDKPTP